MKTTPSQPEAPLPRSGFVHGVHVAVPMDIVDGKTIYEDVRFGFVTEDGETYGVTECRIEATEIDLMPTYAWVTVTDVRGKVHRFSGARSPAIPGITSNRRTSRFNA